MRHDAIATFGDSNRICDRDRVGDGVSDRGRVRDPALATEIAASVGTSLEVLDLVAPPKASSPKKSTRPSDAPGQPRDATPRR